MKFYQIFFYLYFVILITNINCLYYESFISNNSSKKAYSSQEIPMNVLNGGSVFNSNLDNKDSVFSNDTRTSWAPGENIPTIMANQCGNTIYDTRLHNCLSYLANNRKDLCHHCKYIKILDEYIDFGNGATCTIEAMCYNRNCRLVYTYLYPIHAKNLESSCKVCENGKFGMYDCKWGALSEVCEDDYDDNFVDDFTLS